MIPVYDKNHELIGHVDAGCTIEHAMASAAKRSGRLEICRYVSMREDPAFEREPVEWLSLSLSTWLMPNGDEVQDFYAEREAVAPFLKPCNISP